MGIGFVKHGDEFKQQTRGLCFNPFRLIFSGISCQIARKLVAAAANARRDLRYSILTPTEV